MTNRVASLTTVIYADPAGQVLFLDGPTGVISPPKVGEFFYLGRPWDVVQVVLNRLDHECRESGGRRPASQKTFATLLGVRQQYASRWANARGPIRLSDDQWAILAKLALPLLWR